MADLDARQLGARVRYTRTRKGLTQEELAQRVGLDRTAINKIETGSRKVAALELSDIARALRVQMASFFDDPLPAVVAHRSSQGLDTVDSQIDSLLTEIASEVEFVHSLSPFKAKAPQKPWETPATGEAVEAMAVRARKALGAELGAPIANLARRVEALGLLVFAKDLGVDTADAGTLLLEHGGVTLINSANRVGRRRLALAHELAHFLVADQYTIDWRVGTADLNLEARFDGFARALLLPREAISTRWKELQVNSGTRSAAVILASVFQVDMTTLARRLLDLGLVDPPAAGDIREVRTTQADMIEFDLHPGDELAGEVQPLIYQQAVLRLIRDERISRERGRDLLWRLVDDADLPSPRTRDESEIWKFVS